MELLDDVDDDISGLAVRPETSWYVQMEPGDVRAVTAEQLRDFYRLGLINRDTYLWQPGAQQWLQLSAFVGNEEPAPKEDEWQVRMGPNDVRRVSLEQLDDFYRLGVVDGETLVWQVGMSSWARLADLIGEESEDEADDIWYALMPSGEAKQLTLEQLDDFYRVDVITERTPVWKEGMKQWLPLGTVAGIATSTPAAVPAASAAPAQPVAVRPTQPVAASAWPAAVVSTPDRRAPAAQVPLAVPSAPPVAVTIAPPPTASASGRWLVRLCIAAGLFMSLQRNDVLFSAAKAYKQQDKFTQLERDALGGPSFGTLRAVDQLVAGCGGPLAPVRLPWMVQERHERAVRESSANAKPAPVAAQGNASSRVELTKVPSPSSEPKTTQTKPEASLLQAVETKATKANLSARGAKKAAVTKATRSTRKAATKDKPVFRGRGDANDPLNGAL